MKLFIKEIFEKGSSEKAHQYFIRFGKGNYKRRFLTSFNKGKKIKVRGSFELANSFVEFVKENKDIKFSGKIFTKEKIPGEQGKKKSGYFLYEVSENSLEKFENPYFYLLDANSDDIVLKIKKKLPKPGKSPKKIDDKFCMLDLDEKYWQALKKTFFWDLPDDVKKAKIEHELIINDIIMPEEDDPVKMRELAKRKGKIIRKIITNEKEETKEREFLV